MHQWKAWVGRITLFPIPSPSSPSPSALELYRRVWGGDPDNFQRQTNALVPAVAQGKHGALTANCSAHPSRLDFSLLPLPPDAPEQLSLNLIEDSRQLHDELIRIVGAIEKGVISQSVSRVAVYVQFLALTSSYVEANEGKCQVDVPETCLSPKWVPLTGPSRGFAMR
jgi:hypothetical protein